MDTVPMCLLILSVLASGVVGHHVDLDQTDASGHDLDLVKDRVYRSVDSDMRYLLESMQSQLKFVTGNLDTVKRMCNFNNQPPRKANVAFSAIISKPMTSSKKYEMVVFNRIVTNIGLAYNASTGYFLAPSDGVFAFTWTLMAAAGKWFNSELVVNGKTKFYNVVDSRGGKSWESSGCTGVLQLQAGQKVWIRKYISHGNYLHDTWSSFSGWQIQ